MNPDRLVILDAVWNKEIGRLKDIAGCSAWTRAAW